VGLLREIIKLFSSSNSSNSNDTQELSIKPSDSGNSYTTSGFEDVTDGLEFYPTFQLSTPCKVLRACGTRVQAKKQIPDYLRSQQEGVWVPKVKSEYSLDLDDKEVGASDAYGTKREDYIEYVCSIKDIYSGDGSVLERVNLINKYREEHPDLLYVESKLLKTYRRSSIIDILILTIDFSFKDLAQLHFSDRGYLKEMLSINTRVEKSLLGANLETIESMVNISKEELIKLDGIGSKSADKILDKIKEIKILINHNT